MSDTRFFLKKVSSGSEMELTGDLAVGRAQDSGLRITEGNPSRHHARLSVGPEGVLLDDGGNLVGTTGAGRSTFLKSASAVSSSPTQRDRTRPMISA